MKDRKPHFDVINILPALVLGRDDTVTEASNIAKGTNGLLMGPILGLSPSTQLPNFTVHVDDVATLHVQALHSKIPGNQDYLAASPNPGRRTWADSFEIIQLFYPQQFADGVFKFHSTLPHTTLSADLDCKKAIETFGLKFKSLEDQIVSVVDHYLELVAKD